jgi:uncharacterized protein
VSPAALYDAKVRHVRSGPGANDFTYGTYQWLVDLDDLPRLPRLLRRLAEFRSADHLGDPDLSLRENVDRYLRGQGVELRGGRILMLTNARVLGHVFNPLTAYWCHDDTGAVACVIAEVHNTYRGRHRYLLFPDGNDRATAEKGFYVSPFQPTDGGTYRMRLPEPGPRVALTIRLHFPDRPVFVAALHGARLPATVPNVLRMVLRHPLPTLTVSARIRWQGIKLYLRKQPIFPRHPARTSGRTP